MAKKKLKDMSIKEVLLSTGLSIHDQFLTSILSDVEGLDLQDIDFDESDEALIKFLIKNEPYVNKEKLVYCTAMNYKKMITKDILKNNGTVIIGNKEKFYKRCLELLKGSKVQFPIVKEKNGIYEVEKFATVEDLLNQKHDEKELKERNLSLLNKMEKDYILYFLSTFITDDDYREFVFTYSENANVMRNIVGLNVETRVKEIKINNSNTDKEDIFHDIYCEEQIKFLKQHAEKIDIDKFLLISAYRSKSLLEDDIDEEDKKYFVNIMRIAQQYIQNSRTKIQGYFKLHEDDNKRKYISYSIKNLNDDVARIRGNNYYSKEDLVQIKQRILSGEKKLYEPESLQLFDLLTFTAKERENLLELNKDDFTYLIFLDIFTKDEIKRYLDIIDDIKIDSSVLDYLYNKEMIEKSDLINMYMRNNIDLQKAIDLDVLYDLQPEVNIEKLIEYYFESKENPDDSKKTKQFDRYRLLFNELKMKNKTAEQKLQIANLIMEELYERDSDYKQDLTNLYKSDLLPIETLIDWNGEDMIYSLIPNNLLKPKDAKDLLITGKLDVQKAFNALISSELSNEEKLNFIFSSFDGNGKNEQEIKLQNDARIYLLQALQISKEFVGFEEFNDTPSTKREKGTQKQKRTQYVSDPVYRWQLMGAIDEEYQTQVYSDGTVKFLLPNVNGGTVILEKMYKKTKKEIKMDYGVATYIMSLEEFLNNKKEIEFDNKINRKMLIEMKKEEKSDKLVHSLNWGNTLKDVLNISHENNYTKDQMQKIDELVDKIEKARELVD